MAQYHPLSGWEPTATNCVSISTKIPWAFAAGAYFIKRYLTASDLQIYPEYAKRARRFVAPLRCQETELTLIMAPIEAIQLLINTFVGTNE